MYANEQAYSYPTTIPYIYTFQSWPHIILPLKVLMNVSGHMANKGAYARGCLYGQMARQLVSVKQ